MMATKKTQAEINAIKDAYAAEQAATKMPTSDSAASRKPVTEKVETKPSIVQQYNDIIGGLPQDYADINAAIDEANAALADVESASTDVSVAADAASRSPGYQGTPTNFTGTNQISDTEMEKRQSAYNILLDEFTKYGLGSLVSDVKDMLINHTPAAEIPLALQNTKAYQTRFSANQDRIKAGLSALSPAEYISLEDSYQNLMRNYGLPASYYAEIIDPVTGVKRQSGFDKLIAGDVAATELESRLIQAQDKVLKANPQVLDALKKFYGDSITNGDILAYSLDPKNALKDIQRKVSAAEIGGAALAQNLTANSSTAEALAAQGITKAQAQQGYIDVAEMAPRGGELAAIYGESPYGQSQAEAEVFGTAGAADAAKKRKKLASLEQASFSGSSGVGALSRDRAFNPYGSSPGAGAY